MGAPSDEDGEPLVNLIGRSTMNTIADAVIVHRTGTATFKVQCNPPGAPLRYFSVVKIGPRVICRELQFGAWFKIRGYSIRWAELPAVARAWIRGEMPPEWWDDSLEAGA